MKNNEILLDTFGEIDDEIVTKVQPIKKTSRAAGWSAISGLCAAAVIAGVICMPNMGMTGGGMLLAAAAYPKMPSYPQENNYTGFDKNYEAAFDAWNNARRELRDQPEGYSDGYDEFFLNSMKVFLPEEGTGNKVYSPMSLYMALGISAEISDGSTRQQILDVLAQRDIGTLRSHAKSMWQANYMDDGMAKCVLATSLWTNDDISCKKSTLNTLSQTYYSSVFGGDPASEAYSQRLQQWLSEQTDDLLTDYISDIKMDPEMILTVASTVNYCGKWNSRFSAEYTKPAAFHSPTGDITCDFLNKRTDTTYYWGEKFGCIDMSLENNGFMRIFLPDEGVTPEELLRDEEALGYMHDFSIYTRTNESQNSKYVDVTISLPKFDVSANIDLKDGLNALGITDIFDSSAADLSPLTDDRGDIFLGSAKQDTRVMIDEEGCRAASLTIMEYCGAAMPEDHVDFIVDRPFLFEIVSLTGTPLFVGVVNDPS